MQPTFFQNNRVGEQWKSVRLAVMQLSLQGFTVLRVTADNKKELPRIEIDKPFSDQAETVKAGDKSYAFVNEWGCCIYWFIGG